VQAIDKNNLILSYLQACCSCVEQLIRSSVVMLLPAACCLPACMPAACLLAALLLRRRRRRRLPPKPPCVCALGRTRWLAVAQRRPPCKVCSATVGGRLPPNGASVAPQTDDAERAPLGSRPQLLRGARLSAPPSPPRAPSRPPPSHRRPVTAPPAPPPRRYKGYGQGTDYGTVEAPPRHRHTRYVRRTRSTTP
jgi:hypothetical protein